MSKMILGRKLGMTQIFTAEGKQVPVTVVQAGPMVVVAKKSSLGKDGYAAVKVGFEAARRQEKDGDVRYRGLTKAQVGVFASAGVEPQRFVREFRCREAELDKFEIGQVLDHTMFAAGESVDVAGVSKGRGFTGVMKRHNFSGFGGSHGAHETHRGGGSIGTSATPSRVFRGIKMAGRSGGTRVTVQNLKIVQVIEEDGLYLIRGAVPGANGGLVEVLPAVKRAGGSRP
ncbi:MAG: 50S ribosomal protein L3 [Myxococcales bacterium]|nr:50S ribosomal protein L3 [Myxococcales bacterium]MCB9532783.1 50S ribosomal protein L3 [Myxococcales bacterium]